MSNLAESTSESGHKHQFQLNIISPSPEVGRLNFPSISTSCTISQLKQKISEASETRIPLPGQQRLIYRGHVLAQEQRTLGDVFGQETIDNTNEALTIHLVFNPGSHQQHAAPSSSIEERADPAPTTQPTQSSQVPNMTEQTPTGAPQAVQAAPLQAQPVPVQNPQMQLQQTFAFMNQQIAAQMAALGANPVVYNVGPNQQQRPPSQPQHQHQPHRPHVHHHHPPTAHLNQALAPHGIPTLQNNPNLMHQQHLHQYMAQQNQIRIAADQRAMNLGTQRPSSAPPPGLGNTNTVIRETYGPNGERRQSIVASGTIQINNGTQTPHLGLRRREASRSGSSRSGTPIGQPPPTHQVHHSGMLPPTPLSSMQLQALQAHMSSMESAMNLGTIPPNSIQEQTQTLLQSVAPTINQQQYQHLESRRQALSNRASAMQRGLDARLHATAEQIGARSDARSSEQSTVYLLSSSSGPQALLVSPVGYFATSWPTLPAPTIHGIGLPESPILNAAQNQIANAQQPHINVVQPAPLQPNGQQQMNVGEVLHPPQEQQPRAQPPNAARDIVRILIPLGGHLWLLIRLFGFVYFFTHGASWHRTILLSIVAFLLFVAQTGLFQPLLQTMWGPIRRHAEALLPLAGNEQPREGDVPRVANADAAGTAGRNRDPTPQEAAERLLREREAQDGDFVRQGLRRIERAIALFVASLVPGVGERHIAAREAAEAARQREEREREERERREEEERQQAQMAEEPGPTSDKAAASNANEPTGEPSPTQDSVAQPPLVEV